MTRRIELFEVEAEGPAADVRQRRLLDLLDKNVPRHYDLRVVHTDIQSPLAIQHAYEGASDRPEVIVLAPSGLMLKVANERFEKATIVFATQDEPDGLGLDFANKPRTGFTYDVNVVPQILSILRRSRIAFRHVGIVVDQYKSPAWRRRCADMRNRFPELVFTVLEADTVQQLHDLLDANASAGPDVWIFNEVMPLMKDFEPTRQRLEARHRIAVFPRRAQVVAGGLMAYEPLIPDPFEIWARQIGMLVAGVPASRIPMERPSSFAFALNLDAARRIGVRFPPKVVKSASLVVSDDAGPRLPR